MNSFEAIRAGESLEEYQDRMEAKLKAEIEAEDIANRELYAKIKDILQDDTIGDYAIDTNYEFYYIILDSYLEAGSGEEYSPPEFFEMCIGVFDAYQSKFVESEYMKRTEDIEEVGFNEMTSEDKVDMLQEEFSHDYQYENLYTDSCILDVLNELNICFLDEEHMMDDHDSNPLVNDPQKYLFNFYQQPGRSY